MEYAKLIHRNTNEIYYSPIEYIIGLEFENKKWLWDLPKNTKIICYKKDENDEILSEKQIFELKDLKLTINISSNDFRIEYVEK